MAIKVSKTEFEGLVERAIAELPEQFAEFLEEVPIEIHTRPSVKLLRELGMEDDELLMGLYRGVDRTRRSVEDSGRLPDVIYIPIEVLLQDRFHIPANSVLFKATAEVGVAELRGNRVYYQDQLLSDPEEAALEAACRDRVGVQ